MLTQLPERIVGASDTSDTSDISDRVVKNIKANNLPTGNHSGSHASPGQSEPTNRANLEERRDREEGQFIITNTSLAPVRNSQEKVLTAATSSIPTVPSDPPSSPDIGSAAQPSNQAVRKVKKETTILEPTFLFSTQTSSFTAAMKSHFFKVATVEAGTSSGPTEGNWNKLQYEIVTESSQVSEDITEVILIRKCSYCGFMNYSWLPAKV